MREEHYQMLPLEQVLRNLGVPVCEGLEHHFYVIKNQRNEFLNNSNKTGYFEFSPRFIHPSLFYHKESRKSIKKWLSNYCSDIVTGYQIVKHRIQMKSSQIWKLQKRIENNLDTVKKEMKLNYLLRKIS